MYIRTCIHLIHVCALVVSYFGSYRFDDVLVGAPLFFKGSSLPEVGAVYVYENTVTVS